MNIAGFQYVPGERTKVSRREIEKGGEEEGKKEREKRKGTRKEEG